MMHKRLFTLSSFRRMLRETGYEAVRVHGIGVPFSLVLPNRAGVWMSKVSNFLARIWPSLMAYQILIEARPKPHSLIILGTSSSRAQ